MKAREAYPILKACNAMRSKKIVLILVLLIMGLCQTTTAQLFKAEQVLSTQGLIHGKVISADFDNDGFMDILLTGRDLAHRPQVFFLKNNKGVSFDSIPSPFIATTGTFLYIADIDNNGFVDVLLMGTDGLDKPVTKLYGNQGGFIFDQSTNDFEPLYKGSVSAFDVDNNGSKDLIFSGVNEDNRIKTNVYESIDNRMVLKKTEVVSLYNGKILPFDFDKDGLIDLFINGIDSLQHRKSLLYKNYGNFKFNEEFEFDSLARGDASTGDFNLDGKTDLLVTGQDVNEKLSTFLYLSDTNQFVVLKDSLPGLTSAVTHIADLNHDGNPDIFMAGFGPDSIHHVYIFEGDTSHLEVIDSVRALTNSSVSLVDIDNDGNLDIIETGSAASGNIVRYFKNLTADVNTGPSKPWSPVVIPMKNKAFFFWTPPIDDVTPSIALTYDLYIGKSSLLDDVKSPESDLVTGYRKVIAHGAQGQSNQYLLTGLSEGTYYWGVQAIDNSYKGDAAQGGGFCEGGSGSGFQLCFTINTVDTTVCKNSVLKIKSPDNNPIYIFSDRRGFLGGFLEYNYIANEEDELYIVSVNYQTCSQSLCYAVKIAPPVNFNLGNDKIVCKNDTVTLQAGDQWKQVKWYVNNSFWSAGKDLILPISQMTSIRAEVLTALGCLYMDDLIIDVYESPFSILKDYTINLGESANLTASGGLKYNWTTSRAPESSSASLLVNPKNNSIYHIRGTDLNGCAFADSVNVKVKGDLFIPNLFSPNGDGANDNFKVYAANIKSVRLQVYDRNGVLMFDGQDQEIMEKGWDGKKNNVLQAPGVYIWTIEGEYINGRPIAFEGKQKGTVRLIR